MHKGTGRGGISRRHLLRTAAAVAGLAGVSTAAGCDLFGGTAPGPVEVPQQLVDLLTSTVALGDAYDDGITRAPSLAANLTGLRDAHRAHAQALAQALERPVPTGGAVNGGPGDPNATLAALRQLETQARDEARSACLTAPDRFAPLVGSIAAARACHLEVLQ